MVLRFKTRKSRSLPGLRKTEAKTLHHEILKKAAQQKCLAVFLLRLDPNHADQASSSAALRFLHSFLYIVS
jgi:hypothetical protein